MLKKVAYFLRKIQNSWVNNSRCEDCEDECIQATGQAVKGEFEHNLDNYKPMKSVTHTYVNKRECGIQECVYHILSGQWMHKNLARFIFNFLKRRFRMCQDEKQISKLLEDSTDISKRNMTDRYIDRPKL